MASQVVMCMGCGVTVGLVHSAPLTGRTGGDGALRRGAGAWKRAGAGARKGSGERRLGWWVA